MAVVVALSALFLNNQISLRNLTGVKLQIAVGVLSEDPKQETQALRNWAIDVLQDPEGNYALSDEAVKELRGTTLSNTWG